MASTSGTYGYRIDKDREGTLKIVGLRETQKALKQLGESTKTEMKETHRAAAQLVADDSIKYVPFRTGALAGAIRAVGLQTSGRVRIGNASVPYAGAIHFGWPARRIKPQPFIYEALDDRRNEIAQLYARRIDVLIRKYDLG